VATAPRNLKYELGLLALLTLGNGVVALDRLTAAFLSPWLVRDLGLNNSQLGLMAGALSLAVAISSFVIGRLADRTGKRRLILVMCTIVFSIGSAAGGLVSGFAMLLGARFLLGFAEGPMVPVSMAVMADTSPPKRRGLNMGIMQMVGAFLLGGIAAPIIVTQIANDYGWRSAFLLSALPGIALAIGMAWLIRDPPPAAASVERDQSLVRALGTLLKIPNMRVSLAVAGLFTSWLVVQNVFLPVYLTSVKGLDPVVMGKVISMGGAAGIVGGIALPALSDLVGRRPVCVIAGLAGIGAPIALLLLPPDPVLLGAAILIGWLPLGIAPLYCAVIPTESVSPALATSAVGLSMGTAELVGGVAAPAIAGKAADIWGLAAPIWICIALALGAGLAALMLRETAPARVA
jgi:MFS family permease